MNFERGQDPVKSMGIGKESILKEIGGIIVSGEEAKKWEDTKNPVDSPWFSATGDWKDGVNVVIKVENGKYEVLKNLIRDDEFIPVGDIQSPILKGSESELFDLLKKLLEDFRKYGIRSLFAFPNMQKVAARTIGQDLVSVQPMSAPIGKVMYLDYTYKNKKKRYKRKKK